MSAYGRAFARAYDRHWSRFSTELAPRLRAFYESHLISRQHPSILDLGCGTGRLALHFAASGYRVTGVDKSEAMLEVARENLLEYVSTKQISLIRKDILDVELDTPCGMAVSIYDTMNHLPDIESLVRAMKIIRANLVEGGLLVFDLNTRLGLEQWNDISVRESDDAMVIMRGIFDPTSPQAYTRISGFASVDGTWERFTETIANTAFAMTEVETAVYRAGFKNVHFSNASDFGTPIPAPEDQRRVFIVAFN